MKPTKIFKTQGVDQNVVFQLLNEKTISIVTLIIASSIAFFLMDGFAIQSRLIFVGLVGFITYALMSIEFEGQKLYTLIFKAFGFIYKPKKLEALKEAEFVVSSDTLILSDRLVRVYNLEPIDYLLLDEDDKLTFEGQIHNFLNILRENRIQLVVNNRDAKAEDYLKHFDSVDYQEVSFKSSKTAEIREKHLKGYKENIKELLTENIIPIREYFIIIPVNCDTTDKKMINRKMKELEDLSLRITRNLKRSKIETKKVQSKELIKFLNSYTKLN